MMSTGFGPSEIISVDTISVNTMSLRELRHRDWFVGWRPGGSSSLVYALEISLEPADIVETPVVMELIGLIICAIYCTTVYMPRIRQHE